MKIMLNCFNFCIFFIIIIIIAIFNFKVILYATRLFFFLKEKIPAFITRSGRENMYKCSLHNVVSVYTVCLQLFFVCVPLLNGTTLF